MLLVPCPTCGPRTSSDFRYLGETHQRPHPNETSPQEWRAYLYLRDNPAGWMKETWYCRSGCRQYFNVKRNTVTNEFRSAPLPGRKSAGAA